MVGVVRTFVNGSGCFDEVCDLIFISSKPIDGAGYSRVKFDYVIQGVRRVVRNIRVVRDGTLSSNA